MARDQVLVISKSAIKKFFVTLLVLVLVAVAGYASWKYKQASEETKRAREDAQRLSDPAQAAQDAEQHIIDSVKRIAIVPDEKPTVSPAIDDATELKKQPLYSLVENGDRVLLYTSARRQIIYRPSTNQIVLAITLPSETTTKDADPLQDATTEETGTQE